MCYLYKGVREGYYFTVGSSVNSSIVDKEVARNLGKVLLEYRDKRSYNENYIVAEYNENLKIWEVYYTVYNGNEVNNGSVYIGGHEQ